MRPRLNDKLKKGKLIPIETENEPEIIKLAESHSEAYALPMRPKEEVSNLTELSKRSSMIRSSILTHVTESEVSSRQRNGFQMETVYLHVRSTEPCRI